MGDVGDAARRGETLMTRFTTERRSEFASMFWRGFDEACDDIDELTAQLAAANAEIIALKAERAGAGSPCKHDDNTLSPKIDAVTWATENITEPKTIAEAVSQRDAWVGSAIQFHRNEEYYRGLLDKIGEYLGDEALKADDGSRPGGILRAKLPELVRKTIDAVFSQTDAGAKITDEMVEAVASALYKSEKIRAERSQRILQTASGEECRGILMEPYEECADAFRDDARAALNACLLAAARRPDDAMDALGKFYNDGFKDGLGRAHEIARKVAKEYREEWNLDGRSLRIMDQIEAVKEVADAILVELNQELGA